MALCPAPGGSLLPRIQAKTMVNLLKCGLCNTGHTLTLAKHTYLFILLVFINSVKLVQSGGSQIGGGVQL